MSKSLMQQIAQYELTKSQIRIADYVAKNQKRILGMTAKELGKETGVSDATIIRFARTVGFKGYTDMQEQVEKELILKEVLPAPVEPGQEAGSLVYSLHGTELGRLRILTAGSVKKAGYIDYVKRLWKCWKLWE